MTCLMVHTEPFDFARCEIHDETFPVGAVCSHQRADLEVAAISARARGDFAAERSALDSIASDDLARQRSRRDRARTR